MPRGIYRSWPQTVVMTAVMATFLLIAVAGFTAGDLVREREWFGLILCSIIAVCSIIGIVLALRMSVIMDSRGLTLRNFGRGRFISWTAIDQVTCEIADVRVVFVVYAPIITLKPEQSRQPSTFGLPKPAAPVAEQVHLTLLGSYSSKVAERRTHELNAARASARAVTEGPLGVDLENME